MRLEFRTDDYPAVQRQDRLQELTTQIWVPAELRTDRETRIRARISATSMGAAGVYTAAATPFETVRTPKLIRRTDPELYVLMLALDGSVGVLQDERHTTIGSAGLTMYDTSRPFRGWVGPDGSPTKLVALAFPRALLPLHPDAVRRLLAVRLPDGAGIGALVRRVVVESARQAAFCRPAAATRLATTTMDLLAALLADELESGAALPPETHRRVLLHQVYAFIQQRLGDQTLSPDVIAATHHISTRYLHKLFQEQGLTVAGWIRDRRLDRCRRDLTDPALASLSIGEIAARWGLGGSAQFSRVFRAAHGMSPREYRQLC